MTLFCLLHGKWHASSCWDPLVERLEARGHAVIAPALPFENPDTTWDERVRPALDALAEAGDDPVVVGHSLAGAYGALVAARRPVAAVVHLCPAPTGLFHRPDAPMRSGRPGFPFPAEDERGVSEWEPEAAIGAMYPRLEPPTARSLCTQLRPGSAPSDSFPLAAHPDVPRRLVYAAEDEFFAPDWERWIAREVLGVDAEEIPGGHFPMIADPAGLAALLSATV
jgi:pimeloyl-ACP methyl ester carboxylesterase